MSAPKTRRDKLVALSEFCDLEAGALNKASFEEENTLYESAKAFKSLSRCLRSCTKCKGLNIVGMTEGCPGWGNLNADVFFVGQSLHEPGMQSDLPFILGSGYLIDAALRLSGLHRRDVFFSNVVHCHPEGNRASTEKEKRNCLPYLQAEIEIVQPKLVILLGNDAKVAIGLMQLNVELLAKKEIKLVFLLHPASLIYSAPENRPDWIVKLSLAIDGAIR